MHFILIPHTHWDREWYLPFEGFRIKLVNLMDILLTIVEKDPEFRFMLDGQTAILEDYLEIKPENEERLKKHIREGRIQIGPWYVQPDEFLISGESLIRNLLVGEKIAKEFGKKMSVGYLPDTFGHIQELPAILNGFGIGSFVFMRGAGDEVKNTEFKWRCRDGSEVIACHLLTGYGNGANLSNVSIDKAVERIELIKEISKQKNVNLLLNGSDHLFPEPEISKRLRELSIRTGDTFELGDLEKYVDRIRKETTSEFEGELRESKYSPILPEVLSTRTYLKQKNRAIEDLIVFYAEPLNVFNYLINGNFYEIPWKELLKNHAHDSICGCGIDEVHAENMRRFEGVEKSVVEAISHCAEELSEKDGSFTVYNPVSWERRELVEVEIDLSKTKVLVNSENEIVPYVISYGKLKFIAKIRGMTFENYRFVDGKNENRLKGTVKVDERTLENEFLKLRVNENGSMDLCDKTGGKTFQNLNIFADQGDRGDEYNFCEAGELITTEPSKPDISKPDIRIIENNPLVGMLKIEHKLKLPLKISGDRERREGKTECRISVFVGVCSNVPRVDITTEVENSARDHRLSILFPVEDQDKVVVGGKFGVIQRKHGKKYKKDAKEGELFEKLILNPKPADKEKGWTEDPPESYPFDRFVDLGDLTIIAKGLFEYSFMKDEMAITLLRCVGYLSRDDLDNRRGHAGPGFETPDAQCQGKHRFEYSLLPHSSLSSHSEIYHQALNHNLPFMTFKGKLKGRVEILPDSLIISCFKVSEDENGIILRLYNVENKKIRGKVKLPFSVEKSWITDLKEDLVKEIEVYKNENENEVNFEVGPYELISLKVKLKN